MKHAYPTNKLSASNHKVLLDASDLKNFGFNDKVFNNWFEGRKSDIVREEGANKYEECIRHLLKTYLTATNQEFPTDVKK